MTLDRSGDARVRDVGLLTVASHVSARAPRESQRHFFDHFLAPCPRMVHLAPRSSVGAPAKILVLKEMLPEFARCNTRILGTSSLLLRAIS
jgi:hypothetical protein